MMNWLKHILTCETCGVPFFNWWIEPMVCPDCADVLDSIENILPGLRL